MAEAELTGDHETYVPDRDGAFEFYIEFSRNLLTIPFVLRRANLARILLSHLFFDRSNGGLLTSFVNEEREAGAPGPWRMAPRRNATG